MNFKEFVNEVAFRAAQELGTNFETEVVEKEVANGEKMTGISIKQVHDTVGIVRYINNVADEYGEADIEDGVKSLIAVYDQEKTGLNEIGDMAENVISFDWVKPRLSARLYNKTTSAEVFISAKNWGFDDLIIVPYVDVKTPGGASGSIKVTDRLLKLWGVDVEFLIHLAFDNMANKLSIQSMDTFMAEKSGMPVEVFSYYPPMYIISNEDLMYGAVQVIVGKAVFRDRFPGGYYVVPSSIHECLILPIDKGDADNMAINEIINFVNANEIAPEEILSDHFYYIA